MYWLDDNCVSIEYLFDKSWPGTDGKDGKEHHSYKMKQSHCFSSKEIADQ